MPLPATEEEGFLAHPCLLAPCNDGAALQQAIGLECMVRGFVALDWKMALKESGAQGAEGKMATLVQFLWNDVIGPLWKALNDVLHRAANYTTTLENEQLGQRLRWYHEH